MGGYNPPVKVIVFALANWAQCMFMLGCMFRCALAVKVIVLHWQNVLPDMMHCTVTMDPCLCDQSTFSGSNVVVRVF